jgi:hypothetical protein
MYIFRVSLKVYKFFAVLLHRKTNVDFARFARAQWFSPYTSAPVPESLGSVANKIDLVFVVAEKDFEILKVALPSAFNNLSSAYQSSIILITRSQDVGKLKEIFSTSNLPIVILDENEIIPGLDRNALQKKFGERYTWVLQQVLKVYSVFLASSDAVLVVDADTVLLNKREWINEFGQQLLLPTDSFHEDYYLFLAAFGICRNPPYFTFVSHHMLIQKRFMVEALQKLNIISIHDLVEFLVENVSVNSLSPLCIDYELYAQFMFNFRSERFVMEPWGNILIKKKYSKRILKSKVSLKLLGFFYDSVSFHSWS